MQINAFTRFSLKSISAVSLVSRDSDVIELEEAKAIVGNIKLGELSAKNGLPCQSSVPFYLSAWEN